MSSPNPFISSPTFSGYVTAERYSSPPSISYGWGEPLYGNKVFPPHLTHDEFTIVNPDFWDHDADKDKFLGWMRMTEVSAFLVSYVYLLTLFLSLVVGQGAYGHSSDDSKMDCGWSTQQSLSFVEGSPQGYCTPVE